MTRVGVDQTPAPGEVLTDSPGGSHRLTGGSHRLTWRARPSLSSAAAPSALPAAAEAS